MHDFPYYILLGKRVFKTNMEGYIKWSAKRGGRVSEQIAFTRISPTVDVSTIFMCIDHNHSGEGKPVVFETMVFGGKFDQDGERYTTYGKALDGHERMVRMVRKGFIDEHKN